MHAQSDMHFMGLTNHDVPGGFAPTGRKIPVFADRYVLTLRAGD